LNRDETDVIMTKIRDMWGGPPGQSGHMRRFRLGGGR
jgi:hypothetical protein